MITQLQLPKTLFKSLFDLTINQTRLILTIIKENQNNEPFIINEIRDIDTQFQHPILTKIFKNNTDEIIKKSIDKIKPLLSQYVDYKANKEDFDEIKLHRKDFSKTIHTTTIFSKIYNRENYELFYNEFKKACEYYGMKNELYAYIMNNKISVIDLRLILFLIEKNAIKNPYGRTIKISTNELLIILKTNKLIYAKPSFEKIKGLNFAKKLMINYSIQGKGIHQNLIINLPNNEKE